MCETVCVCIWCRLLYPGQMSPWIMSSYGPSFVHTEGYGHALGTSWGVGGPSQLQPRYSECNSDVVCPPKCRCEAGVVECSNLKLTKIPERIPQSTAEL